MNRKIEGTNDNVKQINLSISNNDWDWFTRHCKIKYKRSKASQISDMIQNYIDSHRAAEAERLDMDSSITQPHTSPLE